MILQATVMGEGAPLVLLHGLLGQARNFGGIQRRLAARHRVIALDLRNHGASPHAPGMTYRAMAEDVRETLAALDAVPAAVVGHSMGGKVAMALALTAPAAVARLMVADIAPVPNPPRFGPMIAAMRALTLHDGMSRAEADAALAAAVPEPGMRAFVLQNLRFGGVPEWKPDLAAIADGLPDILGWPEFDATYAGPTLFLGGTASDYILPEHRPLIRALFPRARIAMLKDAGHWLHADNPEGFLAVVESFAG